MGPTPSFNSGQTHTTQCYEWADAHGGSVFEAHIYGAVEGTSLELQMTNDGSPPVGRHIAKVYDTPLATAEIAVIPDASTSETNDWYHIPDVASHTSYWTVGKDKRSGTVDAWLWQAPYQAPPGGDLHVYGRWSC